MAEVPYDDIFLNITSRLDTRGLNSAVTALKGLQSITGFSGLKQAGEDLKGFIDTLNGLSARRMKTLTDFANSIKGVGGIGSAMKAVAKTAESGNPLNDTSMGTANAPSVDLASKLNEGDATQMWNDIASAIDGAISESAKFNFSLGEDLDIMLGVGRDVVGLFNKMGNAIKTAMEKAKNAIQKVFIGGVLGRFANLVRYRIMRAIISGIADGVKEGFSNLEAWDRRGGNTGFAESMDRARESLLVLKNSLAVVGAPFLEGLISVLQQVAQWAMVSANAISRLFAILGGKSSYRAVKWADYTANAVKGTTGAVRDAGKEFKKQLMAFDEINNITEQNGSNGSGGYGNSGYFNFDDMFEEREVGELSEIDKKLKQIYESLKPVVEKLKEFGAPLASIWDSTKKIVSIFGSWLGQLLLPAWDEFIDVLISVVNLLASLLDAVAKLLDPLDKATKKINLWQGASLVLQGTLLALGAVIDVASGIISGIAYVVQVFTARIVYLGDCIGNLWKLMSGQSTFTEFKQNMEDAETKMNNTVLKATNDLYSALDRTFGKKYNLEIDIKEVHTVTQLIDYLGVGGGAFRADGGFVDRGDLFIANEAGAEMVGTIGGHTAVANNDQIVSAVSTGVAQAVSSVLGGQSTNVNVTLEGDAKGIFKVVQKEGRAYSARTGQPALA